MWERAVEVMVGNGPLGVAVLALAVAFWRTLSNASEREDKIRREFNEVLVVLRNELNEAQQSRVTDAQKVVETMMNIQEQSIQAINSLTAAVQQLQAAIGRIEDRRGV